VGFVELAFLDPGSCKYIFLMLVDQSVGRVYFCCCLRIVFSIFDMIAVECVTVKFWDSSFEEVPDDALWPAPRLSAPSTSLFQQSACTNSPYI
jgi:hypothetical protein